MSAAPPLILKRGEGCQVRAAGAVDWISGVVVVASTNGYSLAIATDHFVIIPSAVHPGLGPMLMLLFQEASATWLDIVTNTPIELAIAPSPRPANEGGYL
jgi:hypothetical protein